MDFGEWLAEISSEIKFGPSRLSFGESLEFGVDMTRMSLVCRFAVRRFCFRQ